MNGYEIVGALMLLAVAAGALIAALVVAFEGSVWMGLGTISLMLWMGIAFLLMQAGS